MIPERREADEVKTVMALAFCLEALLDHGVGRETPEERSGLPELKRKTLVFEGPRCLEFAGWSFGKKGTTQNKSFKYLHRDPLDC